MNLWAVPWTVEAQKVRRVRTMNQYMTITHRFTAGVTGNIYLHPMWWLRDLSQIVTPNH